MEKIEMRISDKIEITGSLPVEVLQRIRERLIFLNPAYESAEKFGRNTCGIPRMLRFISTLDDGTIITPRGFVSQLRKILDYNNTEYAIENRTRFFPSVDFKFSGKLYPYQMEASEAMLRKNFGVLQSPTGSGKTTIALRMIAMRKQPCLIVVHTKELLHQWVERIKQFLGIPESEIGLIGGGQKFDPAKLIHVGIVNSLRKCADTVKDHIGFLIVDECHRVPGATFSEVVGQFDSAFVLGLSATPFRRDGLTRLIWLFIGDKRHEIGVRELQENSFILKPELRVFDTDFYYDYQDDYTDMARELTQDADRNELIVSEIINHSENSKGVQLVISDRKMHCLELVRLLQQAGHLRVGLLIGSISGRERHETVRKIETGNTDVIVATSQLIGEGFDAVSISSIHLCMPISFSGKLSQVIGRVVRTGNGKRAARIFDYHDCRVGVLSASFTRRLRAYRGLGIGCDVPETAFAGVR